MKPGKKNLEKAEEKIENLKRTLDTNKAEQVKGGVPSRPESTDKDH